MTPSGAAYTVTLRRRLCNTLLESAGTGGYKPTEADETVHTDELRWTPWTGPIATEGADETPWLLRMRLQTFRLLLLVGTLGLAIMITRSVLMTDEVSWAEVGNLAFFALLLALSFLRPHWLKTLAWLGLFSLFLNAVDGLDFFGGEVVVPVLMLLPLLILYASLLGDPYMTLAALAGVLSIYTATWVSQSDLTSRETLILTNLIVLTILSAVAALGVWLHHSRLVKALDVRTEALRNELATRLRLQAMVTHDIRSPLTALVNASLLDDPALVQEMAGRIVHITNAAQDLTKGATVTPAPVTVADIWQYMEEILSERLLEKDQRLETHGDSTLVVEADLPILCNSIVGNFLTNASKFSPRGATIRMTAEAQDGSVRIAVLDEGTGLPEEIQKQGPDHPHHRSESGTEGEGGTGYGLQIAALCAARMNGRVEIGNGHPGGAISVLLPRICA